MIQQKTQDGRNFRAALLAYQSMIRRNRERAAPAVRAAHARGLLVDHIAAETGYSPGYVKTLLDGMGLTPHRGQRGRRAKLPDGAVVVPCPDGEAIKQRAAAACVAHFRDLIGAYPGLKLRSLAIPPGYAFARPRADVAPGYGSPSALCADLGAGR